MRIVTSAICLAGSLLLATPAAAQDPEPAEVPAAAPSRIPLQKRVGFDLFTSGITPQSATLAGTGERAFGGQLTLGVTAWRVLDLSGDFGIIGMKDEAQFSQPTTGGEKSSGVAAGMLTLAAGLRTPPLQMGSDPTTISAGVSAGRSWLDVNRTITDCVDCHGEDVEIGAGSFWEPGVHATRGRGGLSARYRVYADGDLEDALMVGYTWSF